MSKFITETPGNVRGVGSQGPGVVILLPLRQPMTPEDAFALGLWLVVMASACATMEGKEMLTGEDVARHYDAALNS